MTYRLGNVPLEGLLRIRIGRTYDCAELHRDWGLPDHVVPRVVRMRLDSRKDAFLGFVYDHQTPIHFLDQRPAAKHLRDEPSQVRGYDEDLPLLEAAIKEEYRKEEVRIAELPYHEMMSSFRGYMAKDAMKACDNHQGRAAHALGLAQGTLQYTLLNHKPVESMGPYFTTVVHLGALDAMEEEFERALIKRAIAEVGLGRQVLANRLQVPRQTISERLAKLGLTA